MSESKKYIPGLVSVITPAYNSEAFICETIESVVAQTYTDWEMIVVDDASNDNTESVLKDYQARDKRIRYVRLTNNQGPSIARQTGVKEAQGQYIAFIDSDDLWMKDKLEKQINFMRGNCCAFSCTAYQQVNERGVLLSKIIIPPLKADYDRVLLDCPVGNSTVMYDVSQIGKCFGPDIKNREDYALWLKMLKQVPYVWGLQEILTKYRIRKNSISRNKFKLIRYHWILYRDFEKLSVLRSLFHIGYWCLIKVLRIK